MVVLEGSDIVRVRILGSNGKKLWMAIDGKVWE